MFIKRLFSTIVLLGLFGAAIFAPSPWNKIVFLLLSTLLTFGLVREICIIVKNLGMETFENITAWFCTLVIILANVVFLELLPAYSHCKRTISDVLSYVLLYGVSLGGPLFILFSKNSGEKIRKLFNSMGIAVFTLLRTPLIITIEIRKPIAEPNA